MFIPSRKVGLSNEINVPDPPAYCLRLKCRSRAGAWNPTVDLPLRWSLIFPYQLYARGSYMTLMTLGQKDFSHLI